MPRPTARTILIQTSLAIILTSTAATPAIAQTPDIARGTVYLDSNANGQRDRDEPGLPGVKVSNGRDVTHTNPDGVYEIPLPPQNILFITKPASYDVPLSDVQLPRFYYIHYPDGTPDIADWDWPVIEPTGPLPESIDFALLPGQTGVKFDAMGFADPQTATDEHLDMLRKDVIEPLFNNPYNAAFGMVAGDVVNDNLGLYERHNRMMAQIGIPIWNVPGNHDINYKSPDNEHATQTFRSVFGPDYYSFDYGLVHFLALNNVEYGGPGNGYRGYIPEEQMEWIANDLADVPEHKLILILTHIPLLTHAPGGDGERYSPVINTGNFADLVELLKRFQYVYGIAGHDTSNSWKTEIGHDHGWTGYPFIAHTLAETRGSGWNRGPRDERGVRPATMADGNPNGYYLFHFDGAKIVPRFIPAGSSPDDRLRVTLEPAPANDKPALDRGRLADGARIVVNLFDGGVRDEVWVAFNDGDPIAMQNIERTDPTYVAQYERFKDTPDAYAEPAVSSHIWQLDLPDLAPGLHVAIITARDEFGLEAHSTFTFEVE